MRQAVVDKFAEFTEQLEGVILYPYQDVKGLVTVGYGCLIDPIGLAMSLPWMVGNRAATTTEVVAGWSAVKQHPTARNWRIGRQASLCNLRLTPDGAENLMLVRLRAFERALQKTFPGWAEFPADVQMAILSMAWAIGSGGFKRFPKFCTFVNTGFYTAAAKECSIRATIGDFVCQPIVRRNRANAAMLRAAGQLVTEGNQAMLTLVTGWP